MFLLNQTVNIIFLTDMGMQFFLPYETKGVEGIRLVTCRRSITMHYFKGWFIVDLVSILPFDMVSCVGSSDNREDVAKLKIIRFVRLLRLIKMVRLLRASRIVNRWQILFAFPYSLQSFCK